MFIKLLSEHTLYPTSSTNFVSFHQFHLNSLHRKGQLDPFLAKSKTLHSPSFDPLGNSTFQVTVQKVISDMNRGGGTGVAGVSLELGIYRVKIPKIRKISFFLLFGLPLDKIRSAGPALLFFPGIHQGKRIKQHKLK